MIASLSGRLAALAPEHAVVEVAGVGFRVLASTTTLGAIGAPGGQVSLFTELLVREDALTLIGFASGEERDWFGLLTGVQGVGARVALAVLSACPPPELAAAVAGGNAALVTRASGVGPKLAQRIVNELKGKLPASAAPGPGSTPLPAPATSAADAVAALTGLGFRPAEAARAVAEAEAALGAGPTLDTLIAEALRRSAR